MVKQRSTGVVILLSLVTCGIYSLYWLFTITNEIATLSDDTSFSGGKELLLCLITCGLYTFFWYYKTGVKLTQLQQKRGRELKDNTLVYLILSIIGLGIISMAMIQTEVNTYAQ